MATSFMQFRGKGFWAADTDLEVWLGFLVQAIDALPDAPIWLREEVRDDWLLSSTWGFHGCIYANLDELAADDDRRQVLVALAETAMEKVRQFGETVPADVLNAMETGGSKRTFQRNMPTEYYLCMGQAFEDLLLGKLQTDASTSPVL